ncbi:hypothetical protein Tco_0177120, partial [Tanacetum coccineum]
LLPLAPGVEDILIEGWMMMENKCCGELMIENHWMDKLLKEVLMIDELSIVDTDKVNHTVEMDMLKPMVEVECFGKCVDEFCNTPKMGRSGKWVGECYFIDQ